MIGVGVPWALSDPRSIGQHPRRLARHDQARNQVRLGPHPQQRGVALEPTLAESFEFFVRRLPRRHADDHVQRLPVPGVLLHEPLEGLLRAPQGLKLLGRCPGLGHRPGKDGDPRPAGQVRQGLPGVLLAHSPADPPSERLVHAKPPGNLLRLAQVPADRRSQPRQRTPKDVHAHLPILIFKFGNHKGYRHGQTIR